MTSIKEYREANPHCEVRQYSDMMQCPRCGLAWDANDPEPPACRKEYTPDQPTPYSSRCNF